MMFGYQPSGTYAWIWLVGAAAVAALIVGIVLMARGRPSTDKATMILRARLARGEINPDEFDRMRETLGVPARRVRGWGPGVGLVVVSLATLIALAGLTLAGAWPRPGPASIEPGAAGFAAGTVSAPRVVRIVAGPNLRFYPDVVPVVAGETITFEVTTMGWATHEFMVGPLADVAADAEGTSEIEDISMMQTKSVTYTFADTGPFGFACHVPGHFEAGMRGTIAIGP